MNVLYIYIHQKVSFLFSFYVIYSSKIKIFFIHDRHLSRYLCVTSFSGVELTFNIFHSFNHSCLTTSRKLIFNKHVFFALEERLLRQHAQNICIYMWWKRCGKTIKWCLNSSSKKLNTLIAFNFCFNKRLLDIYIYIYIYILSWSTTCLLPNFLSLQLLFFSFRISSSHHLCVHLFTCFIMTELIPIRVLINKVMSLCLH